MKPHVGMRVQQRVTGIRATIKRLSKCGTNKDPKAYFAEMEEFPGWVELKRFYKPVKYPFKLRKR